MSDILIFIDASFIIALASSNDQWHEKAKNIAKKIPIKDRVISNLVMSEAITMIGKKVGGEIARKIFFYIEDNYILYQDHPFLNRRVIETFRKFDGKLSFADSFSVEIMKELKITKIVSFDSDFDEVDGIVRIH